MSISVDLLCNAGSANFSGKADIQPQLGWIERRAELYPVHPLIASSIALPTPPIKEVYQDIRRNVVLREPGCCILAGTGVGKSFALHVIAEQLRHDFPGIVVYRHNAHYHNVASVRGFFQHFLSTVHQPNRKGETFELRLRLVNTMADEADQSTLRLVVLLIDEAQELLVSDYRFLKDVYNDLEQDGIHLICVLMGEPPSNRIPTSYIQGDQSLIDRFSHRIFELRSFVSVADIRYVLQAIDSEVFLGSPPVRWTQFFFPLAYDHGFRLESQAGVLLAALKNVAHLPRLRAGVPARLLFGAIKVFLIDFAGADSAALKLPQDAWSLAVRHALPCDLPRHNELETDGTDNVSL
nr:ATP-binding protein [Burkholderia ambifaria]